MKKIPHANVCTHNYPYVNSSNQQHLNMQRSRFTSNSVRAHTTVAFPSIYLYQLPRKLTVLMHLNLIYEGTSWLLYTDCYLCRSCLTRPVNYVTQCDSTC